MFESPLMTYAAELKRRRGHAALMSGRAEVEATPQMWSARCENEYEGTPVLTPVE